MPTGSNGGVGCERIREIRPQTRVGEVQVDGEFELGVESVGCLAGNDYGGKNKAKKSTYQEADHQGDHRFPLSSRLRLNQCFEEDRNVLYGITVPLMGFKGI